MFTPTKVPTNERLGDAAEGLDEAEGVGLGVATNKTGGSGGSTSSSLVATGTAAATPEV